MDHHSHDPIDPCCPRRTTSSSLRALAAWTAALDEPDVDLSEMFDDLIDRLTAAVPTLIAAALTIDVGGRPVTLTSPPRSGAAVESTLSFPLPVAGVNTCVLILAASTPGAFAGFAHDAVTELGVAPDIARDAHLSAFDDPDDPASDVDERSVVDVAVGILLDNGSLTAESALTELVERAAGHGQSLLDAAHATIAAAGERAVTDEPAGGGESRGVV